MVILNIVVDSPKKKFVFSEPLSIKVLDLITKVERRGNFSAKDKELYKEDEVLSRVKTLQELGVENKDVLHLKGLKTSSEGSLKRKKGGGGSFGGSGPPPNKKSKNETVPDASISTENVPDDFEEADESDGLRDLFEEEVNESEMQKTDEIREREEFYAQLEQAYGEANENIKQLQDLVNEHENEKTAFETQIKQMQENIQNGNQKYQQLVNERDALQSSLRMTQNTTDVLKTQLGAVNATGDQKDTHYNNMIEQLNQSHQAEIENVRQQINEEASSVLNQQLQEANKEIEEIQGFLVSRNDRILSLEEEGNKLLQNYQILENEYSQLQGVAANLQHHHENSVPQDIYQDMLNQLNQTIQNQQQDILNYQKVTEEMRMKALKVAAKLEKQKFIQDSSQEGRELNTIMDESKLSDHAIRNQINGHLSSLTEKLTEVMTSGRFTHETKLNFAVLMNEATNAYKDDLQKLVHLSAIMDDALDEDESIHKVREELFTMLKEDETYGAQIIHNINQKLENNGISQSDDVPQQTQPNTELTQENIESAGLNDDDDERKQQDDAISVNTDDTEIEESFENIQDVIVKIEKNADLPPNEQLKLSDIKSMRQRNVLSTPELPDHITPGIKEESQEARMKAARLRQKYGLQNVDLTQKEYVNPNPQAEKEIEMDKKDEQLTGKRSRDDDDIAEKEHVAKTQTQDLNETDETLTAAATADL